MELETQLGDELMGFWRKNKKRVKIGALALALMGTGALADVNKDLNINWGPQTAIAGEAHAYYKERYEYPGAIAAEKDEKLKLAWWHLHNRTSVNSGGKRGVLRGEEMAAILLRMTSYVTGPNALISDETFNTSFAYRLMLAKVDKSHGIYPGDAPSSNRTLNYFSAGVGSLFARHRNREARENFAKGLFVAASLTENDYRTLQRAGIDAKYDKHATIEANALNLANIFVYKADLNRKERMLSVIWEKFKNVKFNNNNNDWNSMEYAMKGIYWNLGFLALADERIEKEGNRIGEIYHWKNNIYINIYSKIPEKYHTYSNKMLRMN